MKRNTGGEKGQGKDARICPTESVIFTSDEEKWLLLT